MMSGGNDGVVKVAGAVRRPSIRPKPVTPPRSAVPLHQTGTWTLPPVRTPTPRMVVTKRPVLALVAADESKRDVSAAVSPVAVAIVAWWQRPRAVALVVGSVLAAAFATAAVVWAASARRDAEAIFATEAVGTTTLASASLAQSLAPVTAPLPTRTAEEPAIPEIDVSRLPSAPSPLASGAER